MKPLLILLALGIFTGSQVFVLSDKPDSKQDQLQQTLKAFFRNLTADLQEKGSIVQRSEFGGGLLGLLHGAYVQASRRLRKLEAELPTEVTEGFDAVVGIPTGVVEKGLTVLYEAWRNENMELRLKWALADWYANGTLGRGVSYAEPFLLNLLTRIQDTNQKLNKNLKHNLDKLRSYAQDAQSQVYEFQELVQPIADHTVEVFKLVVEKVNVVTKPYFAPILKAAREHTAEFKKWVSAPVFPPKQ